MNKDVNIHNVIVDRAEAISAEQCRVICPYCSPTRKKKKEKTLSVKKEPDKFVSQSRSGHAFITIIENQ